MTGSKRAAYVRCDHCARRSLDRLNEWDEQNFERMSSSMDDFMYILIFVAIVVAVFLYVQFKEKANLKKAATGEDKARFEEAVRKAMGELMNGGDYTIAYSHWEDVQYRGRTTKTTYYHYALAFDDTRLWIMPLRFEKELIMPDKPVLATSEMLGIVTVTERVAKKTGKVDHVSVTLNGKEGKKLVDLAVDAVNTKEDRFHHLNLLQEEECVKFCDFMKTMSGKVSQENADLPDRLKAEANAKKAKNALIEAIVGIVLGIIFPFMGIILGFCAIATAPKPKANGGKWGLPLILGIVATVISVVFLCLGAPVTMLLVSLISG